MATACDARSVTRRSPAPTGAASSRRTTPPTAVCTSPLAPPPLYTRVLMGWRGAGTTTAWSPPRATRCPSAPAWSSTRAASPRPKAPSAFISVHLSSRPSRQPSKYPWNLEIVRIFGNFGANSEKARKGRHKGAENSRGNSRPRQLGVWPTGRTDVKKEKVSWSLSSFTHKAYSIDKGRSST